MPGYTTVETTTAPASSSRIDEEPPAHANINGVDPVFQIASGNPCPIPTAIHHIFGVLAVIHTMAVDHYPEWFIRGTVYPLDVVNQLRACNIGRGNIEFDSSPICGAKRLGNIAVDTALIGDQQGGCQRDLLTGLGIDETIPAEVSKIVLDNPFSGQDSTFPG